jgi:hypothetical protein
LGQAFSKQSTCTETWSHFSVQQLLTLSETHAIVTAAYRKAKTIEEKLPGNTRSGIAIHSDLHN